MEVNLNWLLNESSLIKKTRQLDYEVLHIIAITKNGDLVPLDTLSKKAELEFSVRPPEDYVLLKKKYDEVGAVAVIYIHNHPEECYDTFTASDLAALMMQRKILAKRGMNLIDLLVVSKDSHYSLNQLSDIM